MDQRRKINKHPSPAIYTETNKYLLQSISPLDDGQLYIYVILNSANNIKIGKTTNIANRVQSLSGSNGAGEKIIKVYCSPATWLNSMEGTCHNHYHFARIHGTEWFDGEKVDFDDVVIYVNGLFYSKGYETCNELRKKMLESKKDDNERN